MFSHIMLGADDVATSKTFYDAALGALGARSAMIDPKGRAMYMQWQHNWICGRNARASRRLSQSRP